MAINPHTNRTYVLTPQGEIIIIDGLTNRILNNITLSGTPKFLSVNPATDILYVATKNSNNITVIDGSTTKHSRLPDIVLEGGFPDGIFINPIANKIYITRSSTNNITVIDASTTKHSRLPDIVLEEHAAEISINPVLDRIYVTTQNSTEESDDTVDNITVIDGRTHEKKTLGLVRGIKDILVHT